MLSTWVNWLLTDGNHQADASGIQTGWLTLDESDDQMPRFLRYLLAVIEEHNPHACMEVTALLQADPNSDCNRVADALSNSLSQLPHKFILVLDDLHMIRAPTIHMLLTRLIDHGPANAHFVLSTRMDPPDMPLNRWRALGALNEVRQQELAFSLAESATFLENGQPTPLRAHVATELYRLTEGWAVGLRLAALALRGHEDPAQLLKEVETRDIRYTMDYLRDEVLDQQSDPVRHFLLCTSILKRFCAELCAAVLEIDAVTAQEQLAEVERANLFLVCLSTSQFWYRYHHQFQNMLRAKLEEHYEASYIVACNRRAAAWFSEHGEIQEAVDCLISIADFEAAADLLEAKRISLLHEQGFDELGETLETIPERVREQRPKLQLAVAWVAAHRQDHRRREAAMARAEALLEKRKANTESPDSTTLHLELLALRCGLDFKDVGAVTMEHIRTTWTRALPYLPTGFADVFNLIADHCQRLGDVETGLEVIDAAIAHSVGWPSSARLSLSNSRGLIHFYECDMALAEREFQATLILARRQGNDLIAAMSHMMLGMISYCRHQVDEAEAHFIMVATMPFLHPQIARNALFSIIRLASLFAYQGTPQRILPYLQRLKEHTDLVGPHYLNVLVAGLSAYCAMLCGDRSRAMGWAVDGMHASLAESMISPADPLPILRARILVDEGSSASLELAEQILRIFLDYQGRHHLRYYLIEASILLAIVLSRRKQRNLALDVLGQAVEIAVPNGVVGHFVLAGTTIRSLLLALHKRPHYTRDVELLLAAMPVAGGYERKSRQGNTQLTERELEVLQLLAQRLSNKEIAERLVISVNTVRNHSVSVFDKLLAHNRVQAIERARELGLIGSSS